ncbi:MAG: single-stranded-DNA-specific exonuclease RecJ [Treponema sp.]|nr:single-stranded-DNA-specific exonuclease RecJ [Treponema sp.]MCL2272710.1 single-stranded-DNA-specific exonuclease RecJ [Treponema sp.]
MKWDKREVSPEQVKEISNKYGCDLLTASILARRGHNSSNAIRYFLEDDILSLRNPFALDGMEDAVERILAAKDEGEKVLVFGDGDVDGITGTALLAGYLESLGMDVTWRIPTGDESYGLSKEAVEEFAAKDGTLIITVDCGISRFSEVRRAAELSIDVIVTDHHEPQDELPEALVIINPKLKNSSYPFRDLSGCGVAFKLVCALRFAGRSDLYGQQICLLNTRPVNDAWIIEIAKIRNLQVINTLTETIVPGMISIGETRLPAFLEGQHICCWDAALHKQTIAKLFGKGVEFGLFDISVQISKEIPQTAGQSLLRIKELSKIAKYSDRELSELDVLINLFTSYSRLIEKNNSSTMPMEENYDIQLAALGTIADIMPLLDENRIIVKRGLESLEKKPRQGILQLLHKLDLTGRKYDTKDISWRLCPAINAARRMGSAQTAADLFFEKDPVKREKLAAELTSMNENRKELEEETWAIAEPMAYKSFTEYEEKLAIVYSEKINKGVTGLMAQRTARQFNVPSIAVSLGEETCSGSLRSARGFNVCSLLEQCSDLFIDSGGHQAAGGFSMEMKNWDSFIDRLKVVSAGMEFEKAQDEEIIKIDAELPHDYLSPEILKLIDRFEPYGKDNDQLIFMTKNITVKEINFIGKPESKHLKMTLDAGKHKWPALYWQNADRVTNGEFTVNDKVDVVFNITRDYFRGNETPQMMIMDLKKN